MVVVLQNSSYAKLDSQYHMMAIRPISTVLVRLTVFSNKDFRLAAKYQRWASRALPLPPPPDVSIQSVGICGARGAGSDSASILC